MSFSEKFITGRWRRRWLRTPVIDGWSCDEHDRPPPCRVTVAVTELEGGALGVRAPDAADVARLSAEAAAAIGDGADVELTVGWPESLVIVRRHGAVLYAEGDPVHFGPLALNGAHRVRRSGYQYLSEDSPEVRVELELDTGDQVRTEMLDPGARVRHGPYEIEHERSYDPSDRPTSLRHHGYAFRIRRMTPATDTATAPAPHPLDLDSAAPVIALARTRGVLGSHEGYLAEPDAFAKQLAHYEGARGVLEETVRSRGPERPSLHRRGETLEAVTIGVARGAKGQVEIIRARVFLEPTGAVRVTREPCGTLPGRLRRA